MVDKHTSSKEIDSKIPVSSVFEVLRVSTFLGLTSFGGPIAHLGYFHDEYIKRRKWLDERLYADLVALCQFLPGPASSQVGIAIGTLRAGILGGIAAWIGFTLPSVIALVLFAYFINTYDSGDTGWIHGLKIVAVAVVAQAVIGMGRSLAPDRNRATIAIVTAMITLLSPNALTQILIIVVAGTIGYFLFKSTDIPDITPMKIKISRKAGVISLFLFIVFLVALPIVQRLFDSIHWITVFDSFYRVGALVFGGGHVVLPLLQREVVPTGWVTNNQFVAGYGIAQAVPGPLFTFAAYLGAIMNGWMGAMVATVAIFLPSFFLVIGALPFWDTIRKRSRFQSALLGVNAAVVGILLAALYNPIWTNTIQTPIDFCLAIASFGFLVYWRLPPWAVVLLTSVSAEIVHRITS